MTKEPNIRLYNAAGVFIGILLLGGGVFIALYAHQCVDQYQTFIGAVDRTLSPAAQREYQRCVNWRFYGALGAIFGLAIFGASLAAD